MEWERKKNKLGEEHEMETRRNRKEKINEDYWVELRGIELLSPSSR